MHQEAGVHTTLQQQEASLATGMGALTQLN
jgi:hypothetical protein